MLFCRYTATADCYFSLCVAMFLRAEFLPFFPFFLKVVVFVAVLSLVMEDKVLRTNKHTGTEDTLVLSLDFEWLSNNSSDGFVILGYTHQNSYLLFSVTNKTSCTVKWINPETKVLFLKQMLIFLNGIFLNKLIRIHFGKIHNFCFLSYFFTYIIISLGIFLPDDFKPWVLAANKISNGLLHKIVSLR